MNLVGEGRFALNPNFERGHDDGNIADAPPILLGGAAFSRARNALRANALALRNEHKRIESEFDVDSLLSALRRVTEPLGDNPASLSEMVRGLATSLRASAAKSNDAFAEPLVLAACAILLLGETQDAAASAVATDLIHEFSQALTQARSWLLQQLKADRYALLSDAHGIANLFYLPVRVSKLIGWLAAGIQVIPRDDESRVVAVRDTKEILGMVCDEYATALSTVSDEQAPYLLVFFAVARDLEWHELNEHILTCYFSTLIDCRGVVGRPGATGEHAFDLVSALGRSPLNVDPILRANPSQLLAALLICGARAQLDELWDSELRVLDHQGGYVYVPATLQSFAERFIEGGANTGFEIGRNVFRLQDVRNFEGHSITPLINEATKDMDTTILNLAVLAACLMPDRLPLHILNSAWPDAQVQSCAQG